MSFGHPYLGVLHYDHCPFFLLAEIQSEILLPAIVILGTMRLNETIHGS